MGTFVVNDPIYHHKHVYFYYSSLPLNSPHIRANNTNIIYQSRNASADNLWMNTYSSTYHDFHSKIVFISWMIQDYINVDYSPVFLANYYTTVCVFNCSITGYLPVCNISHFNITGNHTYRFHCLLWVNIPTITSNIPESR